MNEQFIDEVMGLVDLVSELTAQYMMVVEQGDEPIDEDRMLKELSLSIRAKLREVVNISKKDQVDAECFRWWVHEAAANPGLVAKSISHCITEDEYREVICGAMVAKDAAIKIAKGAK